ncbi:MAG: hypothetical protein AB7O39_09525 [Flavobacteriaceae bacterium]
MIGLSYDMLAAARAGGVCVSLLTVFLLIRSYRAARVNYKRTELWLMLDAQDRPPAAYAPWAVATALRDAYLRFAQYAAFASIILWTAALGLSLLSPAAAPMTTLRLDAAMPPV